MASPRPARPAPADTGPARASAAPGPAPARASAAPAPVAPAPVPAAIVAVPAAVPAPTPAPLGDARFVRNSSFLSRDIEAQKRRPVEVPPRKSSIPAAVVADPEPASVPSHISSPPTHPAGKLFPTRSSSGDGTPPVNVVSPPPKRETPPRNELTSPLTTDVKAGINTKDDTGSIASCPPREESPVVRDDEKMAMDIKVGNGNKPSENISTNMEAGATVLDKNEETNGTKPEESNGVGDKIKKFEKAAEDAGAGVGRLSRPGSVRGRPRTERLGSDNSREDLPPPATPFKDTQFDLTTTATTSTERPPTVLERQQSLTRNTVVAPTPIRWQRTDSVSADGEKIRPEPQKIIKPEFKPMASPIDVTIRSPSLGAKIGDQFPSHGTAFRNVATPDASRVRDLQKINDDVNTQNNFKTCKFKNKEKYSVSKGSSYFTRGSEEIWLVKKKDIEEIEERVLDSFRRAGGNICMRSESMRPSSDSGQSVSFSHATMGRNKRANYARSESLDPQWAGTRAHTLKRQTSVACTCGHDKKPRAKSVETAPRPRSRSHGDDNTGQGHVLDKYETLV